MTLSLVQSYLKITFFFFFPKGIHKLIPKGIKEQAGAQRSQAQLRLGLGFTPTNLHQIDEKESFKHLLFTAPNSHNQPYFVYSKLLLYYPGFEGDGGGMGGCNNPK